MLLNQLKGIVLSMEAIRCINPEARLIQTEDLGKTHSTPRLSYQAGFENARRWLTFDILCGKFAPGHSLWHWFVGTLGIDEKELQFFIDRPCPPDVLGLNYYVTSERWLDEDLRNYPVSTYGGNGREAYADTEVVRVFPETRVGLHRLGEEVWNRYQIPLAITEAYLHCTREEQMRWWAEIWQAAQGLCREGIPVLGVTAWSLLGAYDWDSLLTASPGHYEPGSFMPDGQRLRRTALGKLIADTQHFGAFTHPLLKTKGWWHGAQSPASLQTSPCLLIVGAGGPVGECLETACRDRGILHRHISHLDPSMDKRKPHEHKTNYWAILHYDSDTNSFHNDRLMISLHPDLSPRAGINQVLDLVIDNVSGSWEIGLSGSPRFTGNRQEVTAFAALRPSF